jgi:glycogen debranching enzyme
MAGGKLISILEGNTFVVSDERGNIDASPTETQGLFSHDTRFLSRWLLTVNGMTPSVLSTDDLQYFSAQFFLVPSMASVYMNADLSIIRTRAVGNGFHEDLTVLNLSPEPAEVSVRIEAHADFADLFAVKDRITQSGQHYMRVERERLVLGYRRERFVRETEISATAPEAELDEAGLSFSVRLPAHGEWTTGIDVVTSIAGLGELHREPKYHSADEPARPETGTFGAKSLEDWLAAAPKLSCDWHSLERIYERSLIDLAALRFNPRIFPGKSLPAAGLPWFMTVFGRDSIFTSLQALPFAPELAESTLMYLAAWQGSHTDDFRDEQPGKIFHEVRFGEMTAFEERPHSPYYGTADATALYLILLDEYERWSGNTHLVAGLETTARAALAWIDDYGDSNCDGYVDYQRRRESGLENQCWKDSGNSILFADGSPSTLPRATCELQGYVYDAKRRCARLARKVWHDPALADRLEREAADLKERFNRDYWISDRQFYALALDGSGRRVDSLTSNIGHLLWSGIADEDKAEACVGHLMSDALFSGWGIRTMASTEAGYNPIGYHVGTVWPFDNSISAWGLARYGYRNEAARIALGILEAAPYFHERLPEAFSGLPRARTRFPVEYPTSCSPQAWSTGAPLLLLRVLLGIEPIGDRLLVDPALPKKLGRLEVLDIPGRWGHADAFGRGRLNDTYAPGRAWEAPQRMPVPIARVTA